MRPNVFVWNLKLNSYTCYVQIPQNGTHCFAIIMQDASLGFIVLISIKSMLHDNMLCNNTLDDYIHYTYINLSIKIHQTTNTLLSRSKVEQLGANCFLQKNPSAAECQPSCENIMLAYCCVCSVRSLINIATNAERLALHGDLLKWSLARRP